MSASKKIREILQVSQEDMAVFLGVSRSQVAMNEKGLRSLPTHALLQLARVELGLHSTAGFTPPATNSRKVQAALKAHTQACQQQAQQCRQQLTQLEAQYQRCLQTLQAIAHLQQHPAPALPGKAAARTAAFETQWLQLLQRTTLATLQHCSPEAQALLRIQIQALDWQAGELGRLGGAA